MISSALAKVNVSVKSEQENLADAALKVVMPANATNATVKVESPPPVQPEKEHESILRLPEEPEPSLPSQIGLPDYPLDQEPRMLTEPDQLLSELDELEPEQSITEPNSFNLTMPLVPQSPSIQISYFEERGCCGSNACTIQ